MTSPVTIDLSPRDGEVTMAREAQSAARARRCKSIFKARQFTIVLWLLLRREAGAWDSESLKRPSGDLHESAGWSLVSALRAEVNLAKSARFALITLCLRHARAPESTFSKDVGVVVLFKLYMHMRMVHVFITMIRVTNTVLKAWSYIEVFCNVRALVL